MIIKKLKLESLWNDMVVAGYVANDVLYGGATFTWRKRQAREQGHKRRGPWPALCSAHRADV